MSLKSTLQSDLKDAMRKGEETRKSTIRMALTAIQLAEVDKGGTLNEAEDLAIIQKEIKSRRETISDAERAKRPDLIPPAEDEIEILQAYLPTALTEEELEVMAKAAVEEAGATSIKDMRQVMAILLPKLQARATGEQASQAVRKLLQ